MTGSTAKHPGGIGEAMTSAASWPISAADGGTQFQGGGIEGQPRHQQLALEEGEPLDKDDITNAYAAAYTNTVDTENSDIGDLIVYYGLDRFSTARVGAGRHLVPARPDVRPQQHALRRRIQVQRPPRGRRHPRAEQLHQRRCHLELSRLPVAIGRLSTRSLASPTRASATLRLRCGRRRARPSTSARQPRRGPYTPKANEGGPGTFQTSAFFEGGINITQLIPDAGCFTAFTAETRSRRRSTPG